MSTVFLCSESRVRIGVQRCQKCLSIQGFNVFVGKRLKHYFASGSIGSFRVLKYN